MLNHKTIIYEEEVMYQSTTLQRQDRGRKQQYEI